MDQALIIISILFPILAGALLLITRGFGNRKKASACFVVVSLIASMLISLITLYFSKGCIKLWSITEDISLEITPDNLSKLFGTLMNFVFAGVGIYALGYLKEDKLSHRFFGFYIMVIGILNGLYMASNLLTMYLFYELMTLLTFPLVLHELSKEAISAAMKYLFYSIAGAFLSLIAIFMIYQYSDSYTFTGGGFLSSAKLAGHENLVLAFVFISTIGFGCKAGMFPLHDWLPTAHPVAPAPASAVLSGIITKSGAFAIIRVVFYSVGADFIRGTWAQYAWIILTLVTVFLGSMMAYLEKGFKKRLAYSSVSQLSYVLFGLSTLHPIGIMGALLHVIYHSIIKDDLFMVAGAIIHQTGYTEVDQLKGIGKRMPLTVWGYTLASLALVGIPPFTGFISKWFLCSGALSAELGAAGYIGPAVLLISALLTAAYLLPITINGFFPGKEFELKEAAKCEPCKTMLIPIIIFSLLTLLLGAFPGIIENTISVIISDIGI